MFSNSSRNRASSTLSQTTTSIDTLQASLFLMKIRWQESTNLKISSLLECLLDAKKTLKMTHRPRSKTGKKACLMEQLSSWKRSTKFSLARLEQVFRNASCQQTQRNWSSCPLRWDPCAPYSHSNQSKISISSSIFKCTCKLRRSLCAVETTSSSGALSSHSKMWLTATFVNSLTIWTSLSKRQYPTS